MAIYILSEDGYNLTQLLESLRKYINIGNIDKALYSYYQIETTSKKAINNINRWFKTLKLVKYTLLIIALEDINISSWSTIKLINDIILYKSNKYQKTRLVNYTYIIMAMCICNKSKITLNKELLDYNIPIEISKWKDFLPDDKTYLINVISYLYNNNQIPEDNYQLPSKIKEIDIWKINEPITKDDRFINIKKLGLNTFKGFDKINNKNVFVRGPFMKKDEIDIFIWINKILTYLNIETYNYLDTEFINNHPYLIVELHEEFTEILNNDNLNLEQLILIMIINWALQIDELDYDNFKYDPISNNNYLIKSSYINEKLKIYKWDDEQREIIDNYYYQNSKDINIKINNYIEQLENYLELNEISNNLIKNLKQLMDEGFEIIWEEYD